MYLLKLLFLAGDTYSESRGVRHWPINRHIFLLCTFRTSKLSHANKRLVFCIRKIIKGWILTPFSCKILLPFPLKIYTILQTNSARLFSFQYNINENYKYTFLKKQTARRCFVWLKCILHIFKNERIRHLWSKFNFFKLV